MYLALSDNYMKNGQMLPVDEQQRKANWQIRTRGHKKPLQTQLPSKTSRPTSSWNFTHSSPTPRKPKLTQKKAKGLYMQIIYAYYLCFVSAKVSHSTQVWALQCWKHWCTGLYKQSRCTCKFALLSVLSLELVPNVPETSRLPVN